MVFNFGKRLQFRIVFAITLIFTVFTLSALFSSVNAGSSIPELDTDVTPLSDQSLVNSILGGGLTASNITSHGTIYTFSHGVDIVGIDAGIVLDTSGRVEANAPKDTDLESLMDYSYGGHTSSLEFTIVAEGSFLNFNYVFVSTEFDQDPRYNDNFGLFVSINGGAYENVATIPLTTGAEVPVNINNLRSGIAGNNEVTRASIQANHQYSLFNSSRININNSNNPINGVSNVFNAQKAVTPGDVVKIKFAIADVTDTGYDSYVLIEADSLSFDEQLAKINYQREVIEKLYSGRTYHIIVDGETYVFTSSPNGEIPLSGVDNNGKAYDFVGKTIDIIRKGIGNHPDSDPQRLVVAGRPSAPEEVVLPTGRPDDMYLEDVVISEDSIVLSGSNDQEYSLDLVEWQSPDTSGHVTFSDLTPNTQYVVFTRYAATEDTPASAPSAGATIVTQNMARNLIYSITNYEGMYDGVPHAAYIGNLSNADVRYSEDLYGTYTGIIPEYTDPGTYTVYYFISKDGYYPAYGSLYVKIKDYDVINTTDDSTNFGNAKLLHSSAELKAMFEYTDTEKENLADANTPAEISLVSTDVTDTVDDEITERFTAELENDEHIGKIIDLSLYQKLLDESIKLTNLTNAVSISLKIPDELASPDTNVVVRSYRMLRLHDDDVAEIETDMDNDLTVTFESDKFSYYAITYTDHIIEPETSGLGSLDDSPLIPDTGKMEETLDTARACAISTIIMGVISALIARLCFLRIRK